MGNVNNVCNFEGRIVRDIDYSTFKVPDDNGGQRQVSKARFTIAVDRPLSAQQRQAAQNNSNIKTADFIPLSATGVMVDKILKPFFFKGKGIHVTAHYTEWQQKDQQTGETKYGHSFEIDDIGFCIQDPKNGNGGNGNNGGGNQNQGGSNAGGNYSGGGNQSQNHSQPAQQNNAAGFSMFDEDNQPF